jgi:hypothetical protein
MMIDTPEKHSILIRHLSWHRFRLPDSRLFPLVSRIHGNVPTEFHFGLSNERRDRTAAHCIGPIGLQRSFTKGGRRHSMDWFTSQKPVQRVNGILGSQ